MFFKFNYLQFVHVKSILTINVYIVNLSMFADKQILLHLFSLLLQLYIKLNNTKVQWFILLFLINKVM